MATPRIGILGGTFNPVHWGHLIMAQDAQDIFELDRILFVPCDKPPHKNTFSILSATHRLAMLQLAIQGNLSFDICDLELRRGGTTYTVDTIHEFTGIYPDRELVFIIGSDTLPELHLWKDIDVLLKRCRFVTLTRPGFDFQALEHENLNLPPLWSKKLFNQAAQGHATAIASSDIRHRIAEGMSIRYLVPPAVDMYITEHKLYRTG